jgi:hypothetical protein
MLMHYKDMYMPEHLSFVFTDTVKKFKLDYYFRIAFQHYRILCDICQNIVWTYTLE